MAKQIVVCSDGTWNTYNQSDRGKPAPTNVRKIFDALTGGESQPSGNRKMHVAADGTLAALYDPGVGTGMFDRFRGGILGFGLSDNIMDGYEFIVRHFEPGSKLYLFGFSRGAYTARSLGGFLCKCGVLDAKLLGESLRETIETVYRDVYRNLQVTADDYRKDYLARMGVPLATPPIEMIGVWDTVGALGIPTSIFHAFNRKLEAFHDTALHPQVLHGYHAVALDEAREAFTPTLWDDREGIEQVWFAGVHSNVGGGYADTGLSDIALAWMLEKAKLLGLRADVAAINPALAMDFAGELRNSREGLMGLAAVKQRDVAVMDRAPVVHGSAVRRIAERTCNYDPPALRSVRPERIDVVDGTTVAPPEDYACRACSADKMGPCGVGPCTVRFKDQPVGGSDFVAARCGL